MSELISGKEAFSRWVVTHPDNLKITAYEEGIMFDAWQAAKAQAVPEGFVLVSVESLALHAQSIRMFNNSDEEDDYYEIENHVCAIEAMIEAAQEPTND